MIASHGTSASAASLLSRWSRLTSFWKDSSKRCQSRFTQEDLDAACDASASAASFSGSSVLGPRLKNIAGLAEQVQRESDCSFRTSVPAPQSP